MISYFPTSGDKHGWAIDEDLRLIRSALEGVAREAPLHAARIVHSPFWAGLSQHSPRILARRFVIAHADNPPFFYLTQPDFAWAQKTVDLWVARSTEAKAQFDLLGLRAVHIPYAIDEGLFFAMPDRHQLRRDLGLPEKAYVIGNFHRDSEGDDLNTPKLQKSPELLVLICQRLVAAGANIHVLLAGPRRHWIRKALRQVGVAFTFVGKELPGDDFGVNILPRTELNRLYNACDLYLIPSRWEGGPQSAMEAAAAKTKMLSLPLGVARDILKPASFFHSTREAVAKILSDIRDGSLDGTVEPQFERWRGSHTSPAMTCHLQSLYREIEAMPASELRCPSPHPVDRLWEAAFQFQRRIQRPRLPTSVAMLHEVGRQAALDRDFESLMNLVRSLGLTIQADADIAIAGSLSAPPPGGTRVAFQLCGAGQHPQQVLPGVTLVFPSAQDVVNFRSAGGTNPALVCPLPRKVEPSGDILTIAEGDLLASGKILDAMTAGQPVIYPEDSAYYYTLFHGGIPYGFGRSQDDARVAADEDAESLRQLVRPPTEMSASAFFRSLLILASH